MKKFILTLMVTLMTVFTSFAQNQTNYSGSSKFTDNVSVGVVGGIETNLNEWNAPQGAVAGILVNKEISPLFGITLEGNTNINGLRNWVGSHVHGNTFDGIDVFLTPRLNLSNAFFKYKDSPRKFEVEAVAGLGYGWAFNNKNAGIDGAHNLLAKTGLNLNYNVTDAWTVMLRPAVVWAIHDDAFSSNNAVAQLTAGVVYHFKTSNGTRSFNKAKLYDQNEVDALNGKINALQKDLNDANATIEVLKNTPAPQTGAQTVVKTVYPKVQFEQGSAKITSTSYANIYDIADALKDADGTIKITGYASTEGTSKYNKELSLKRAEAVKKALVKAGVSADKIQTVGAGATDKFSPDELNVNRVVTTNE